MTPGIRSSRKESCLCHEAFENMQDVYLTPGSLSFLSSTGECIPVSARAMCWVWCPMSFLCDGGYSHLYHTTGVRLHLQPELMEHPHSCRGVHSNGPFLKMRPRSLVSVLVLPCKGQDTLTGITDPGQAIRVETGWDLWGRFQKESPAHLVLRVTSVKKHGSKRHAYVIPSFLSTTPWAVIIITPCYWWRNEDTEERSILQGVNPQVSCSPLSCKHVGHLQESDSYPKMKIQFYK